MDIKTKLKSRKFWIGVALVVLGSVMWFFGEKQNGVTLITMGGVSYIGMEGIADIVSRANVIAESVSDEQKVIAENEETDIQ